MMPESTSRSASSAARSAASARRSFRSLKLAWTDADSGEQFTVSLRGGAQMLGGLQQAGFELIDEATAVERQRGTAGPAALGRGDSPRAERAGPGGLPR